MRSTQTSIIVTAATSTCLLVLVGLFAYSPGWVSGATMIPTGTVMVGTGSSIVTEFDQDGNMIAQLDTTTGSAEMTGSGFDSTGNFFTTNFDGNQVTEFDSMGSLIGPFGSGYNFHPESIVFDAAGNVYVGQADGTRQILKFDSTGSPTGSFSPATEDRGTDWIDLAADQCTIFYTSEGPDVLTFNVCTNTQGPQFNVAALPGGVAYAHRIRPNGEVLVANTTEVTRLDAAGNQVQHYTLPGTSQLFALNLDPDGTSFWTADLSSSGEVFKVDIASGAILKQWSAVGVPGFVDVAGLAVKGEIIVSVPTSTETPVTTTPTPTATATPGGSLCGNGIVDPGETCDDGNTVGGCRTDKPQKPIDNCNNDCTRPMCKDPSRIYFCRGLDRVRVHGRIESDASRGALDPTNKTFELRLSSGAGTSGSIVFQTMLTGAGVIGDMEGVNDRRVMYRNPGAIDSGGIAFLEIRKRAGLSYAVTVEAYGDLRAALSPMMTHVLVGSEEWTVAAEWTETAHGWRTTH